MLSGPFAGLAFEGPPDGGGAMLSTRLGGTVMAGVAEPFTGGCSGLEVGPPTDGCFCALACSGSLGFASAGHKSCC